MLQFKSFEGHPAKQVQTTAFANDPNLPPLPAQVSVRVAVVGEPASLANFEWLAPLFPRRVVCTTSESYLADICPSREWYDFLIIAGVDTKRMIKLIKHYRPALGLLPKVAAISRASPADRAKLLRAGFDDVFTGAMSHVEANARSYAILGRYKIRQEQQRSASNYASLATALCCSPLKQREEVVLAKLIRQYPRPVPLSDLQMAPSPLKVLKEASVRVLISRLRTKLIDGVTIQRMTSGYVLVNERDDN